MKDFLAKLKGFRTFLVNGAAFVASLPTTYNGVVDAVSGVDLDSGDLTSFTLTALAAAGVLLRLFTNTSPFKAS